MARPTPVPPSPDAASDAGRGPLAPRLSLRLYFGEATTFGRGKAELLERIRDGGSISAAGRAMGMSYKRAWSLVEEMNAAFARPLVESSRGGTGGGGAVLTDAGEEVLRRYRAVEAAAWAGAAPDIAALRALLREPARGDAVPPDPGDAAPAG